MHAREEQQRREETEGRSESFVVLYELPGFPWRIKRASLTIRLIGIKEIEDRSIDRAVCGPTDRRTILR